MTAQELRDRTKKFAVLILRFSAQIQKTSEIRNVLNQLVRSATSVAANYRAATRGRSDAEFYAKMCIVTEEADESVFWLEVFEESKLVEYNKENFAWLKNEAEELMKIMSASKKTSSEKLKK